MKFTYSIGNDYWNITLNLVKNKVIIQKSSVHISILILKKKRKIGNYHCFKPVKINYCVFFLRVPSLCRGFLKF